MSGLDAERADVVVVGARCAGTATATALARSGRHVVALDRVAFPADTISTHLLWPSGLAELQRLGALDRVLALGAPPMPIAMAVGAGLQLRGGFTPVDGIGHALCVRRTGLDAELVAGAREAGADVRERVRVTDLVHDSEGRVVGVRYEDDDRRPGELRAPLVVGADGRRSTVAREVGAQEPYRSRPSGRACFYSYWKDGAAEGDAGDWRHVAAQWREQGDLGTAFPCDDGLVLVLLQPPVERAAEFRGDLEGTYRATIASMPGLAARLEGAELVAKVRAATGIESYFRRSSGPGWALAGDAGHFKDPVTAQGIRDALRFGRLLGEAVAPVLDDPDALDAAVRAWELRRERECLETYQWTNTLARGDAMTALEVELYREAARSPGLAREVLDVFSRSRRPSEVLTTRRALRYAATAARRDPATLAALAREIGGELRTQVGDRAERLRAGRAARGARSGVLTSRPVLPPPPPRPGTAPPRAG